MSEVKKDVSSLLKQAKNYLEDKVFFGAKEIYENILNMDPDNDLAHLGLLMVDSKTTNMDELLDYYKNLYNEESVEIVKASDLDQSHIEDMIDKYSVPSYLDRSKIEQLYEYDDFYYPSLLSSRRKQKQQLLEEIESNTTLNYLSKSKDPEIVNFFNELRNSYDQKIKEAEDEDKYNAAMIRTNYQRFLFKTYTNVKELSKKANNDRKKIYTDAVNTYETSDDVSTLESLIDTFRQLEDYEDSKAYIEKISQKTNKIRQEAKQNEFDEKINGFLNSANDYLGQQDFERADETFLKALALDPDNDLAHLGLLMVDSKTTNMDELLDYYKNLYNEESVEIVKASDLDQSHIEDMIDKYSVPSYLDRSKIEQLYEYDDFYYPSLLSSRRKQKQQLLEEIESNTTLNYLSKSKDPEIVNFFNELRNSYDQKIKEAEDEDKYNAAMIRTNYQRFLFKTYTNVKELSKKANNDRKKIYTDAVNTYETSDDVSTLESLIDTFRSLEDYEDSKAYIEKISQKTNKIRQEAKQNEFDEKINGFLNSANDYLGQQDFERADETFLKALALDPDNDLAHLGLLMVDSKTTNMDELLDYYKNLYNEESVEIVKASDLDQSHIEDMIDKYSVPSYLDRSKIEQLYEYDDFYYPSLLSSRRKQKQQLLEEIESNTTLNYLSKSKDPEIVNFFNELRNSYDQKIKEAEDEDKYNAAMIRTNYQRFLFKTYTNVKELSKKANNDRKKIYTDAVNTYETSEDVSTLESLIDTFRQLEDYEDSKAYIEKISQKTNKIRQEAKQNEFDEKINGFLNSANDYLGQQDFERADETFLKALALDPDNDLAHLGLLMVDSKTTNMDELLDYYKNLYNEESVEIVKASDLDQSHIEDMIDKYSVPSYLDRSKIEQLYEYDDFYYPSLLSSRRKQKQQLLEEIESNTTLNYLSKSKDPEIIDFFNQIKTSYDVRIKSALNDDKVKKQEKLDKYHEFEKDCDRQLIELHEQFKSVRQEDIEKQYNKCLDIFDRSDLDINELEDLISKFNQHISYKQSRKYIELCYNRIEKLKRKQQDNWVESFLAEAKELIDKDEFDKASVNYLEVLSTYPDNSEAYVGLLLCEGETHDVDELFNNYLRRYSKDQEQILQARRADQSHIDEMVNRYAIDSKLDKETIEDLYKYDFSYKSYMAYRFKQKERLLKEINDNDILSYLKDNGDDDIKKRINSLISKVQDRVDEAIEHDKHEVNRIEKEYEEFLKETDNKVIDLYSEISGGKIFDSKIEKIKEEPEETIKEEIVEEKPQEETVEETIEEEAVEEEPVEEETIQDETAEYEIDEAIEEESELEEIKEKKKIPYGFIGFILAWVLVLCALGYGGYRFIYTPLSKYNNANKLYEQNKYDEALDILSELGDYRDSIELIKKIKYDKANYLISKGEQLEGLNILNGLDYEDSAELIVKAKENSLKNVRVGSTVLFGDYEQDDTNDGREIIEWIVLEIEEDRILLVSKNALDVKQFHDNAEETYWDTCYLRSWLNGRFAGNAFSNEDPTKVLITMTENYRYDEDGNREEYESSDYLFLLSLEEVEEYFPEVKDRKAQAAKSILDETSATSDGSCDWWLRTPASHEDKTVYHITPSGETGTSMYMIMSNGVRPAMWLSYINPNPVPTNE